MEPLLRAWMQEITALCTGCWKGVFTIFSVWICSLNVRAQTIKLILSVWRWRRGIKLDKFVLNENKSWRLIPLFAELWVFDVGFLKKLVQKIPKFLSGKVWKCHISRYGTNYIWEKRVSTPYLYTKVIFLTFFHFIFCLYSPLLRQ